MTKIEMKKQSSGQQFSALEYDLVPVAKIRGFAQVVKNILPQIY